MLKNGLVSVFCLMMILSELSGQILVSEQAQSDQAAGKLWSALGNKLSQKLGCSSSDVSDLLKNRADLSENHLRWFLRYFLNYNVEGLDYRQISYRYPHYAETAIQEDMDHFSQLGLIYKRAEGWALKDQGYAIINDYWALKIEDAASCEASNSHLTVFTSIARRIISAYDSIQELPSLQLRIRNRPAGFEAFPIVLQAFVFQQELSAAFNDIGHHRFDNLLLMGDKEWVGMKISPVAAELMGATRNNRVYAMERCYNQSFWRVGTEKCDEAVKELLDLGLMELQRDSISQTSRGKQYFTSANDLADQRIYSAWDHLTNQEYESFRRSWEWLNE